MIRSLIHDQKVPDMGERPQRSTLEKSVYISGPLHGAVDLAAARRLYETIAAACKELGWSPYLPHQNTDPERHACVTPTEVFARDMHALRRAELIIAHIGAPSSGVGAELAFAVSEGKTAMAIHHHAEVPSRFIVGMLGSFPGVEVREYGSLDDCRDAVKEFLAHRMRSSSAAECWE